MEKPRHVPRRMCAGCRKRFAKEAGVRFTVQVRGGERLLVLDPDGLAQGRGAYVCPRMECLEKALAKGTLTGRLGAAAVEPRLRERFTREIEQKKP